MKVLESFPGRTLDDLCPTQHVNIKSLVDTINAVDLPKNAREATTSVLRSQIDEALTVAGWKNDFVIDSRISLEFPTANYNLDLSLDSPNSKCEHRHRFLLEFCFDNRQAIGTNLLKFEIATLNSEAQQWKTLPILVCATSRAIKEFGWDSGVGSYQEYDHALRIPYSRVISHPPVLIAIN